MTQILGMVGTWVLTMGEGRYKYGLGYDGSCLSITLMAMKW